MTSGWRSSLFSFRKSPRVFASSEAFAMPPKQRGGKKKKKKGKPNQRATSTPNARPAVEDIMVLAGDMRSRLEAAGVRDVGPFFSDLLRHGVGLAGAINQFSSVMAEGERSGKADDRNAKVDLGAGGRGGLKTGLKAMGEAMTWMLAMGGEVPMAHEVEQTWSRAELLPFLDEAGVGVARRSGEQLSDAVLMRAALDLIGIKMVILQQLCNMPDDDAECERLGRNAAREKAGLAPLAASKGDDEDDGTIEVFPPIRKGMNPGGLEEWAASIPNIGGLEGAFFSRLYPYGVSGEDRTLLDNPGRNPIHDLKHSLVWVAKHIDRARAEGVPVPMIIVRQL